MVAIFGLRLAYLRGAIINLQKCADTFTEETYKKFVEILSTRKKDRDPEKALNLAAQYFSWKDNQKQLVKFYRNNKYYEFIDMAGIAASVLTITTKQFYDVYSIDIFIIAIAFIFTSVLTFLKSYFKLNGIEKKLGIGQAQPTH